MSDIIIKNLSKCFGEKIVLKNLNLSFKEGEITCIMAPSGKGKTTLLRIIAGLEEKSEGEMSEIPEKISYLFQEDRLCEDFRSVANVRFVVGKSRSEEEITNTLLALGLDEQSLSLSVKKLSGGMKRRVAIARAILCDYDLLLLDEPFKGLDETLKIGIIEFVREKTRGKTTIVVTHDKTEAELLGAEIIEL